MKNLHVRTALIVLTAAATPSPAGPDAAVVKVASTGRFPNLIRPWTKLGPTENTGTGIIMPGNKILTCAHLLSYATEVTVQGRDGGRRVEAEVKFIGRGIDLAVLTPSEPEFLSARPPLPRVKGLPEVMAPVLVYGYPIGGNGLSVTRGIISRRLRPVRRGSRGPARAGRRGDQPRV